MTLFDYPSSPVLVDKPVTPTSDQARELYEIARSRNLVLYAYQNRRWDSDFLALKKLLSLPKTSAQSLGTILEFESQLVAWHASSQITILMTSAVSIATGQD